MEFKVIILTEENQQLISDIQMKMVLYQIKSLKIML